MFRNRLSPFLLVKSNRKALYNHLTQATSSSSRVAREETSRFFSTGIVRRILHDFRSSPKVLLSLSLELRDFYNAIPGQYVPSLRNVSTVQSLNEKSNEGLKLLVNGGSHAQKMVGIWLFGSAAWVFSMVVLGGVTRLTRSGLSMTDWKFSGGLPPLSDEEWLQEFEKYKLSPEYKKFEIKNEPPTEYAQPRVSPYRLAAHLTSAFVIYSGLLWTGLSVVMPEPPAESMSWVKGAAKVKRLALPVSLLVGITAVSGAFVAGNDAGHAYNTFPKMGDTWIPEDVLEMKPLIRNFFENTSMVQLDHRILATTTLVSIASLWWLTRKVDLHPAVRYLIGSTVGMAGLQVTLGISTLLSYVPVSLGSAHQAGALTLMSLMILLIHTLRKPSPFLLKSLPKVAKTI
ncbi:cytochrome c oxidase assembly protein COX15-like [Humulus lupulus]|uniref:cytochrome c oxidase assembly protein COX15-like n=1 Tax=Humulus lupulus TaxID=3486 RepID=UPI002B413FFD|nr:cytochrome c oxidase assembly protein COX15-like [Humulus lupulus]